MILITGMPRSGTSFMQSVFVYYGAQMDPKQFSMHVFRGGPYSLSEPAMISNLCSTGGGHDQFNKELNLLKSNHSSHPNIVLKSPQLCFYPKVCEVEFSKIIVCMSPLNERYYSSGRSHNLDGWLKVSPHFLRPLKNRTLVGLSKFWSDSAKSLINKYPEKTERFLFGNKRDFDKIFLPYMSQELIDEAYKKLWRGSRF